MIIINQNQIGNNAQPGVLLGIVFRLAPHNPVNLSLGYVPFSKEGAELLFQILAERYEKKPVIIRTNLGFGDWTQIFGDPTLIRRKNDVFIRFY